MTNGIDGVFFISISSLFCGGVALCIKQIYKIKCSEVKCCGCVIKRDIEEEAKIDIENTQNNTDNRRSSLTLGLNHL
jgi:hypothetical protein